MGKNPVKRLKQGSIPTLNLPSNTSVKTLSAIKRDNKMEAKLSKEVNINNYYKNIIKP